MDLKEIRWEGVASIDLTQDGGKWWTLEHDNEPLDSIKFRDFLTS